MNAVGSEHGWQASLLSYFGRYFGRLLKSIWYHRIFFKYKAIDNETSSCDYWAERIMSKPLAFATTQHAYIRHCGSLVLLTLNCLPRYCIRSKTILIDNYDDLSATWRTIITSLRHVAVDTSSNGLMLYCRSRSMIFIDFSNNITSKRTYAISTHQWFIGEARQHSPGNELNESRERTRHRREVRYHFCGNEHADILYYDSAKQSLHMASSAILTRGLGHSWRADENAAEILVLLMMSCHDVGDA